MSDEKIKDLQRQLAKLTEGIAQMAGDREIPSFGKYANQYLDEKLKNPTLRESTKTAFAHQAVNHLIPAFGPLEMDKITNYSWLQWVTSTKGITRFFNARKALVEILCAAKESGHIEKVPKFDNPDTPKSVGRALSDREVLRILKKTRDKQFRLFFYVLWKMGCRPREILKWEWQMIIWNEPGHTWIEIPARISKTDRTRRIPVNPNVSRRLYRMRDNGSPFVFPSKDPGKPQLSYNSAWKTACKRAGVDAVPYDLRRSFITRCAAEGKPLVFVAKALDTSVKMIEAVYVKAQADVMEDIVK